MSKNYIFDLADKLRGISIQCLYGIYDLEKPSKDFFEDVHIQDTSRNLSDMLYNKSHGFRGGITGGQTNMMQKY